MESTVSFEAFPQHLPAGRYTAYVLLAITIAYGLWKAVTYTDIPFIRGLPEVSRQHVKI